MANKTKSTNAKSSKETTQVPKEMPTRLEVKAPTWATTKLESGRIHKFESVGDSVEGIFKGYNPGKGKGKSATFKVETAPGQVEEWYSSTYLNQQLPHIKEGKRVSITFVGLIQTKKGNPFKEFAVFTN